MNGLLTGNNNHVSCATMVWDTEGKGIRSSGHSYSCFKLPNTSNMKGKTYGLAGVTCGSASLFASYNMMS